MLGLRGKLPVLCQGSAMRSALRVAAWRRARQEAWQPCLQQLCVACQQPGLCPQQPCHSVTTLSSLPGHPFGTMPPPNVVAGEKLDPRAAIAGMELPCPPGHSPNDHSWRSGLFDRGSWMEAQVCRVAEAGAGGQVCGTAACAACLGLPQPIRLNSFWPACPIHAGLCCSRLGLACRPAGHAPWSLAAHALAACPSA